MWNVKCYSWRKSLNWVVLQSRPLVSFKVWKSSWAKRKACPAQIWILHNLMPSSEHFAQAHLWWTGAATAGIKRLQTQNMRSLVSPGNAIVTSAWTMRAAVLIPFQVHQLSHRSKSQCNCPSRFEGLTPNPTTWRARWTKQMLSIGTRSPTWPNPANGQRKPPAVYRCIQVRMRQSIVKLQEFMHQVELLNLRSQQDHCSDFGGFEEWLCQGSIMEWL